MKFIGISKVAAQKKITLIESVAESLKITIGDQIAFLRTTSGDIIIKKLSDIEMKDSEVES
jgi:bifunctional DNA-binding transcriptional regulator/antitoxin component of YhaV-PrlF toxin-antitoxin module